MTEDIENKLRTAFGLVFAGDYAKIVLDHLAEFAHADDADFCNDPRKSEYLQGRRSVVLEIRKLIKE
jgi:hypothetical protein